VSNPALDLWLPLYGFRRLGVEEQLTGCLQAAGISDAQLDPMRPEVEFLDFRFPLLDMLHGLDINDGAFIEDGVRMLNASLSSGLKC
jgi:hypothetical protein